jgi:hypothetical protein
MHIRLFVDKKEDFERESIVRAKHEDGSEGQRHTFPKTTTTYDRNVIGAFAFLWILREIQKT